MMKPTPTIALVISVLIVLLVAAIAFLPFIAALVYLSLNTAVMVYAWPISAFALYIFLSALVRLGKKSESRSWPDLLFGALLLFSMITLLYLRFFDPVR